MCVHTSASCHTYTHAHNLKLVSSAAHNWYNQSQPYYNKSGRLRWSILFWAIQFRKYNSVSSISSRVKYNRFFALSWEQRHGDNKKYFLFVTFLRGNTQKSIETETADIGWPGKTLHVSYSTATQQAQAAHSAGVTWKQEFHLYILFSLALSVKWSPLFSHG